jgi:hypothetical protein
MGVGDLAALADAAHVGAAGLTVGFAIRFLTSQDTRGRGDSNDEVPIVPTMYGRLATATTTARCPADMVHRTETTATTSPCGC